MLASSARTGEGRQERPGAGRDLGAECMEGISVRPSIPAAHAPEAGGHRPALRTAQRGAEVWRASAAHRLRRAPRARRTLVCQADYLRHESGSGGDCSGCAAAGVGSTGTGSEQPAGPRGAREGAPSGRRPGTAGGRGTVEGRDPGAPDRGIALGERWASDFAAARPADRPALRRVIGRSKSGIGDRRPNERLGG
jgi:hypothetical protein